jgi:hypothetical protein
VITFLIDFGASRDALQYLTEWRRPGLLDPVFIPLAGGIVFIVIGAVRQLIRPKHLWLLVPFLVLSFTSVRAIPPAWLASAPLMAISLAGLNIGNRAGLRAKLAVVFGLVVFGMPFLLIKPNLLDHERFPIDAVAGLDASRLFHSDIAGGFLIWGLGPSRQVYIDDRAELYGERMAEFVGVRRGDLPWKPVFERDGIGQVLLAGDEPLVASLEAAGWRQMYSDENFVVLRP